MATKQTAREKKAAARRGNVRSVRTKAKRRRLVRRVIFGSLVLVAAALTVLTLVYGSGSSISAPENLIGTVVTKVEGAVTSAVRGVKQFFTDWHSYNELSREYDDLSRKFDSLNIQYQETEELRRENERLTSMLGARSSYGDYETVFARVNAKEAGAWFDTFTIDAGSSDGISRGMAVMSSDGLVGLVDEVGYGYSKVRSIIDSRSSIAVLVQSTRDNGIMKGRIQDGAGSDECFIYYLPGMNNIMPGDSVVTSGTDSQYVKGLFVGKVSAISVNESSEGVYAVVQPAADFERLEEVLVIRHVPEAPERLEAIVTAAPAATPTPTPAPTDGITPQPTGEDIWQWPTLMPSATPTPQPVKPIIDMLEDTWAEN